MPDELYGQAGVEADQGYTPIPAETPEQADSFGSDESGLTEAAAELIKSREQSDDELVERTVPEKRGDEPDKRTLKAAQGADLIAHERGQEDFSRLAQTVTEAGAVADQMRAEAQGLTPAQPAAPEIDLSQPQPETPPPDGVDPEIARALENPKIRSALEAEVSKVSQAQQAYTAATMQAADLAAASVFASCPELQGLNPQQIPVALQIIAKQDPAKGAQIAAHIGRVQAVYSQAALVQQQRHQQAEQQYQRDWSDFASKEDATFLQKAPEMADANVSRKIADTTVSMLREFGFSDGDVAKAWDGKVSISLRDHRAQLILLAAAKYMNAKNIPPARRDIPNVQRPGVSEPRANSDAYAEQSSSFNKNPTAKNAAALITARRAAQR